MIAQWTADLVGKMHQYGVKKIELAKELDVTPEYVSMILNGHKEPKNAKEKFEDALQRILDRAS